MWLLSPQVPGSQGLLLATVSSELGWKGGRCLGIQDEERTGRLSRPHPTFRSQPLLPQAAMSGCAGRPGHTPRSRQAAQGAFGGRDSTLRGHALLTRSPGGFCSR